MLKDVQNSKAVKSIKIEVIFGDQKQVKLLTQFDKEATIRILKEWLINLEGEALKSSTS